MITAGANQVLNSTEGESLGTCNQSTNSPVNSSVTAGTPVVLAMAILTTDRVEDEQRIDFRKVGTTTWLELNATSNPLRTNTATSLVNADTLVTGEATIPPDCGITTGGNYVNGIEVENARSDWTQTRVENGARSESHFAVVDNGSLTVNTSFQFRWFDVQAGVELFIGARRLEYTIVPDTTFPTWNNNSTSGIQSGEGIQHFINLSDNSALANYTFSFDNGTGTFVNDSTVVITGTTNFTMIYKIVNSTVGSTIRWRVYVNDSSGNTNVTDTFTYITVAQKTIKATNSGFTLATLATTGGKFGVKICAKNNSILVNVTKASLSTATKVQILNTSTNVLASSKYSGNNANFSFPLVKDTCYYVVDYADGATYSFIHNEPNAVYPLDRTDINYTAGVQGSTEISNGAYDIINITTNTSAAVDTTSPKWQNNQTNSTTSGRSINHSVNWTDETALANYTFSFDNGTGTFVNDSVVLFTGTQNFSNVVKIVNSTVGSTIRWRIYANDSSGNTNVTSIFSYITTSSQQNFSISASDTKTINSQTNDKNDFREGISDSSSLNLTLNKLIKMFRSPSDFLTSNLNVFKKSFSFKSLSNSLTYSFSLNRVRDLFREVSNNISISTTLNRISLFNRIISDSLLYSLSIFKFSLAKFFISLGNILNFVASFAKSFSNPESLSDSKTFSTSINFLRNVPRQVLDNLLSSLNIFTDFFGFRSNSDSLTSFSTTFSFKSVTKEIFNNINYALTIFKKFFGFRVASDTGAFSSSVISVKGIFKNIFDSSSYSFFLERVRSVPRAMSDFNSFSSNIFRKYFNLETISDSLTYSLSIFKFSLSKILISLSDALNFASTLVRNLFTFEILSDSKTFSTSINFIRGIPRQVIDSILYSFNVFIDFFGFRSNSDSATLFSNFNFIRGIPRQISDSITSSFNLFLDLLGFRSSSDSINIFSNFNSFRNVPRQILNNLIYSLNVFVDFFSFRSSSDSVTSFSSISFFKRINNQLSESILYLISIFKNYFGFVDISEASSFSLTLIKIKGVFVLLSQSFTYTLSLFVEKIVSGVQLISRSVIDNLNLVFSLDTLSNLFRRISDNLSFNFILNSLREISRNIQSSMSFNIVVTKIILLFRNFSDVISYIISVLLPGAGVDQGAGGGGGSIITTKIVEEIGKIDIKIINKIILFFKENYYYIIGGTSIFLLLILLIVYVKRRQHILR